MHSAVGISAHLFERLCEGVGRLERGDQPFLLDRQRQRLNDLAVRRGLEAHAPGALQVRENRRHADVVEPGGDAVRVAHLAVVVLDEIGAIALGDADPGVLAGQARSVLTAVQAMTARLHSDQLDLGLVEKTTEDAHRIGAAASLSYYSASSTQCR